MNILLLMVFGAAAGFLATRFMRVQTDVITTIFIGVCGALVAGLAIQLLTRLGAGALFLGAVPAAMGLIWLWRHYFRR